MAIDDLNIYTRLCEISGIYIGGDGEMRREKEEEIFIDKSHKKRGIP